MESNSTKGPSFDGEFSSHTMEQWEALARKSLPEGQTIADLATHSLDGLDIKALYVSGANSAQETNSLPALSAAEAGIDNRIRIHDGNAKQANNSVLDGLKGGASSIELRISDEDSKSLNSSELSTALDGVYLDIAPVSIVADQSSKPTIDALERVWNDQNINDAAKRAHLNVDPLDHFLQGQIPADSIPTSLKEMAHLANRYASKSPGVAVASVNVARHHNAGASVAQELIAAIATATPYAEALLDEKLSMESICNNIVFKVACDADFLMNVVKLRALKRLWGAVCSGLEPGVQSVQCQLATETSTRMQATQSPWINHLRNTSACTAAMVGGASSISVIPHNYVNGQWLDQEKDLGARMARNLPIILQQECLLTSVYDPMAGSYAIESLTDELVDLAWKGLLHIERSGGWMEEITSGRWADALTKTQTERVAALKSEDSIRVGVNRFQVENKQTDVHANEMKQAASNSQVILNAVRDAAEFGA